MSDRKHWLEFIKEAQIAEDFMKRYRTEGHVRLEEFWQRRHGELCEDARKARKREEKRGAKP